MTSQEILDAANRATVGSKAHEQLRQYFAGRDCPVAIVRDGIATVIDFEGNTLSWHAGPILADPSPEPIDPPGTTRNYADVLRREIADDPELAAMVAEEAKLADAEVEEYERRNAAKPQATPEPASEPDGDAVERLARHLHYIAFPDSSWEKIDPKSPPKYRAIAAALLSDPPPELQRTPARPEGFYTAAQVREAFGEGWQCRCEFGAGRRDLAIQEAAGRYPDPSTRELKPGEPVLVEGSFVYNTVAANGYVVAAGCNGERVVCEASKVHPVN